MAFESAGAVSSLYLVGSSLYRGRHHVAGHTPDGCPPRFWSDGSA